jgi:hypothetical protein
MNGVNISVIWCDCVTNLGGGVSYTLVNSSTTILSKRITVPKKIYVSVMADTVMDTGDFSVSDLGYPVPYLIFLTVLWCWKNRVRVLEIRVSQKNYRWTPSLALFLYFFSASLVHCYRTTARSHMGLFKMLAVFSEAEDVTARSSIKDSSPLGPKQHYGFFPWQWQSCQ